MPELIIENFDSRVLGRRRKVRIWLPDAYAEQPDRAFPLVLKHDGQLAFSERDEELPYGSWQLDLRIERLHRTEGLPLAVIVGVDNSPQRLLEYFPVTAEFQRYQEFLIEELLPWLRERLHVATDAANTHTMGSSMGGLVSFALAANNPGVFGACGCLSPWFEYEDNTYIRQGLRKMTERPPIRVYMDSGIQDWRGLDDGHRGMLLGRIEMLRLGFVEGADLVWQRDLFFPTLEDLENTPVNPDRREHCRVNQHQEFHFGRRSEHALRYLLAGRGLEREYPRF